MRLHEFSPLKTHPCGRKARENMMKGLCCRSAPLLESGNCKTIYPAVCHKSNPASFTGFCAGCRTHRRLRQTMARFGPSSRCISSSCLHLTASRRLPRNIRTGRLFILLKKVTLNEILCFPQLCRVGIAYLYCIEISNQVNSDRVLNPVRVLVYL